MKLSSWKYALHEAIKRLQQKLEYNGKQTDEVAYLVCYSIILKMLIKWNCLIYSKKCAQFSVRAYVE